jgi:hypothetical protein
MSNTGIELVGARILGRWALGRHPVRFRDAGACFGMNCHRCGGNAAPC